MQAMGNMTAVETLKIAVIEMPEVVCGLAILAIAIFVYFRLRSNRRSTKASMQSEMATVLAEEDNDEFAVLLAVICEDMREDPDNIRIVKINEIP